jgi:hypothetical protein
MGIRKVKLEDVIPPKVVEVKTYSKAVYVEHEDVTPTVKEIPTPDSRLIKERLKELEVSEVVYFPEYRLEMMGDRIGPRYRQPPEKQKTKFRTAVYNNATAMGLKVSIYWVKTKNHTVTMRVTLK